MSEIIVSSPNAQSAFYMEEYTYFERYTAHERLEGRQKKIKPMVDDYFVWVKKKLPVLHTGDENLQLI